MKTPEQMRAHILQAMQKTIANHKAGIPCPTLVRDEKDYRRAIACMIRLPKICPLRRCRRVWRCLGDDAICLQVHRAKAAEDVNVLLGWQAAKPEPEEQDELGWGGHGSAAGMNMKPQRTRIGRCKRVPFDQT